MHLKIRLTRKKIEDQELKEVEQRKKILMVGVLGRASLSKFGSFIHKKSKHLDHGATYPEKLCDKVIKMYSNEKDLVLDPFLGTGTTLSSAIKIK